MALKKLLAGLFILLLSTVKAQNEFITIWNLLLQSYSPLR